MTWITTRKYPGGWSRSEPPWRSLWIWLLGAALCQYLADSLAHSACWTSFVLFPHAWLPFTAPDRLQFLPLRWLVHVFGLPHGLFQRAIIVFVLLVSYGQFPAYGAALWHAKKKGRSRAVACALAAIHVAAVLFGLGQSLALKSEWPWAEMERSRRHRMAVREDGRFGESAMLSLDVIQNRAYFQEANP